MLTHALHKKQTNTFYNIHIVPKSKGEISCANITKITRQKGFEVYAAYGVSDTGLTSMEHLGFFFSLQAADRRADKQRLHKIEAGYQFHISTVSANFSNQNRKVELKDILEEYPEELARQKRAELTKEKLDKLFKETPIVKQKMTNSQKRRLRNLFN